MTSSSIIVSPQNERVKKAARLREKRDRDRAGLFMVEGLRETERALACAFELVELFLLEPPVRAETSALAQRLEAGGFRHMVRVGEAAFAKLAVRESSDGLFAVFRQRFLTLDDLRPKRPGQWFLLMVDGMEKPGNLGALVRTADGAGVDAILVAGQGLDIFNPNAIRASIGALFNVPIVKASEDEMAAFMAREDIRLVAAVPEAPAPYFREDFTGSVCLVLGSEAFGVSPFWQAKAAVRVGIPMLGKGDSLNISVAGAVLAYEVCRQRVLASTHK